MYSHCADELAHILTLLPDFGCRTSATPITARPKTTNRMPSHIFFVMDLPRNVTESKAVKTITAPKR